MRWILKIYGTKVKEYLKTCKSIKYKDKKEKEKKSIHDKEKMKKFLLENVN